MSRLWRGDVMTTRLGVLACITVLGLCACDDAASDDATDGAVETGDGDAAGDGDDPGDGDGDAAGDGDAGDGDGDSVANPADAGNDAAMPPAGPRVDRTDPGLHEFELDPEVLDPSVSDSIEPQYALLDTQVEPLGKLVLFLTGSTNIPAWWRDHGRQLAGYGFHVVIPHYDNRWSAGGQNPCNGMGGDCSDNVRWEALTGEDASDVIDIPRADSAEGRAIRMLEHLVDAHPGGDWGYYLDDDGGLRGAEIIIAGISHGATNTGLFATRRAFHRAVMHSGGYWRIDNPATPIDAIYGFSHTDDDQHPGHLDAWEAGGLLGAPTSIDDDAPPYGDSRRLITSAPNGYPHCSVAVSNDSPTDGQGNYLFDTAWRTMYGAPAP